MWGETSSICDFWALYRIAGVVGKAGKKDRQNRRKTGERIPVVLYNAQSSRRHLAGIVGVHNEERC